MNGASSPGAAAAAGGGPRRVVLLGPPGAGKGTQAALLAARLGVPHLGTGDMIRSSVAAGDALGVEVKRLVDRGALVPDDVMIELIRDRLVGVPGGPGLEGFILDGFPRTLPQAEALSSLLGSIGKQLSHVVEFRVDDDVLMERIAKRGAAGSGRADDDLSVARHRLDVYRLRTLPVAEFYRSHPGVTTLDGVGEVSEVHARVLRAIGVTGV